MDLQKLKVTELRAELQARGLDTKGVKAQLIDRLKEALDLEQAQSGSSQVVPLAAASVAATEEPPETPRVRRSSRSRTRSPEPVATKIQADPPNLQAVAEEPEETAPAQSSALQKDTEMYEKIIDEMDVDNNQQQDDEEYDEDALLADNDQQTEQQNGSEEQQPKPQQTEQQQQMEVTTEGGEEKTESGGGEGEEGRGIKRRAESPSKGTSPKKRQRLPPPNIDDFVNDEDEPELDENTIQLSWFDSDLNLKIDRETFCSAQSLFDTGLALVWAGARANYGAIANGKYFYEVQLMLFNKKISYPNERNLHEIRCGWSTSNTSLQLGESELSFALDSSGKKCTNSEFTDYFSSKLFTNDVVGVHLELTDEKCSIAYTVNGKDCGVAFEFERSTLDGQALFPHISTKNVEYKVNFGAVDQSLWTLRRDEFKEQELKRRRNELEKKKKDVEKKREEKAKKEAEKVAAAEAAKTAAAAESENAEEKPAETEEATTSATAETSEEPPAAAESVEEEEPEPILPDDITEDEVEQDTPYENRLPGYIYIAQWSIEQLSKGPRRPEKRTDCEVIMMIGLPGAGKSHWAVEHAKEFPDKRYTLLGTKYLLERMKIAGQPRKRQNNGPIRWEKLIELCNRGLITLNEIACKRRRNYILDQPHVYISDQRRKMRVFGDFKRIACIVVPKEEEYKNRVKKRLETEGKDIHDAAVNEMRANITLPELEYLWFNEIIYSDLEKEAAVEEVTKENERGKRALSQRNRQNDFNRRGGGGGNFNNQPRWMGNNQQRNDFRRNNWGPPNRNQMGGGGGGGFNRNFDNRGRNNWNNGPDNWNRPRGGYGGGPFSNRPGQQQQQMQQKRPGPGNQQNRNDRFRQGGGGGNNHHRGGNKDNRGPGGQKKFGGKDWNSQGGGQWSNNWGNNYQNWNNQWNQNQYGGSNSSTDNSGDTNQQWMAYYQQSQNPNWFSSDGNYGGAFSSNSNYDNSQTKQ